MSTRKQIAENQKILYDDAVANNMFQAAVPSFEEFQKRLERSDYQKIVYDNYRKHDVKGTGFNSLEEFRGKFGGSFYSDEAKREFNNNAQYISDAAKQSVNNFGKYNKLKQHKQKQKNDFGRVTIGSNKTSFGGNADDVVKDDFAIDPATGKTGAYITSDNDETSNLADAQQKQAALDSYNETYQKAVDTGEIPSVFDVRDKDGNYDLQENIGKDGTYLTEEGAQAQLDKKLAEAYARKEELENAIAEDDKKNGNPLLSYSVSMGGSNGRDAKSSDYRNQLAISLSLVKQQIGSLEAVKQYPTSSMASDAWKALDNTAFTAKTWDFGITDFATMGQMERIKSKMDNKIPLTISEQTLLKSKLGADAAAALEDEKMGNVYRWTKIAGQSLPFMLDFFLTGGYGGITDALSKSALKFAAKKGMGKISAAVLKNTGVVLGDIAGSYAMAGTTQAFKTGADIMQRHMGNLYQDENGNYAFGTFDENGNLVHEGGESFGTALYKGLTSAMVENYTEKLFGHSYGVKKGALAFMEKHGMVRSAEFFKNIGKKEWYAGAKKWMGKFGINGFGEEVMEEEIGIPLHALLDGDNKFSDLWDAKQQLDIIGGMAISVGSMYAMGAGTRPLKGVYNRAQYYRFKHKVTAADNEAFQLLGEDYWPELRERMDNATNEQMGGVLYSILQGRDTLSKEQIKAAVMYGVNLMKMRGYNLAKTAEMNAREMTGEQETNRDNHDNEIENAYSEGHDAEGESTHAIQLEQNESATRLAGLLGITEEQLHDMSDDELEAKAGENDELDEAIYDYQASTAKYQGAMDNANDKVDMAGREAALMIDQRTDLKRGTVRTASIKATKGAEDYDVFIISGNLATHDDGTIDISSSDQMILYYDPKTGRKEYADPGRFASVGEEQSAEEAKNQAVMEAKDKVIREQAGIIDGKVEEGSTFVITDADGTEHTYEVLADNGDGTAMITLDGNVEYNPYSLNDLQQLKDAEDQKKLIAARQQRAELESQRQQQKQNEQKQNEENQARISQTISEITDDNGNVVIAAVEGEEDADSFIVGEYNNKKSGKKKYKVVTLNADGTVSSPRLVDTSKVTIMDTMPADEYQQVLNDTQTTVIEDNGGLDNSQEDNLGDELPPVPDNVTINGDGTYSVDGEKQVKQESQNEENTPAVPSFTLSDGTEVPMREDGNPDTTQMTAAQTAEFYDTQFGEDAEGLINGWVSDAKKALDTANKMTVKGKDFVEQKASKDAKTKAIADAQAKYDSAQAIADAYKERMLAKQESTAEGRRSILDKAKAKYNRLKGKAEQVQALWNETVGTVLHRLYDHTGVDVFDSTPQTIEEYVSSSIAPFSLNYEGNDNSKGVKQETGLERKDFAKSHVLAAEGKGITVDEFVHKLWENRPAQFESATDQDIRNALIDLITSDMNAYDMRHVIENNRIAQAEKAIEDEQNAAESAAHEEGTRAAAEEETPTEAEITEAEEGAPAETDDALPFAPSDESDVPFSERDNNIIESQQERAENVEKNHVDDTEVVDAIVGKKVRKALERIARMMGAKIQWQYSDKTGNGWYDEATNTIYLTLDSSITEGAQFIFGHEMTHEIKSKNPAAYEELKTLVKDMLGEDTFETMTDVTEQKYRDAGIIYTGGREAYEEEVVADQIGTWLNDANYAHTLALKMSHPLLAAIHDIIVRIKMAFNGTEYTDNAKQILRTIEQAYVATANREAVNTATQEGEGGQRFSLKEPNKMSDEEKAERGMKLIEASAIDVESGVIKKKEGVPAGKAAKQWWEDNVGKSLFYNTEVGRVEINDKSIKDSLAHRYSQAKLDAITSLPKGFDNAVYLGTMKDFTRNGDVKNHYFAYPINYEGKRNYVFCRAMQDANKNRLYVHEVFVADKINEGNTLQTTASQPHGGIALYRDILANILSAAKVDNSSESSKENGEKFSLKGKPVRFEADKSLSEDEKKEVLATMKDAISNGNTDITDSTGEVVAQTDADHKAKFSLRTWLPWTDNLGRTHEGTRQQVLDYMEKQGFSKEEITDMQDTMDYWYNYMSQIDNFTNPDGTFKFRAFHQWNEKQPQYKKVGKNIENVVSTKIKNGEYAVNQELSTDCIKREAFTKLVNTLIARGADLSMMGPAQINTIKNMMRKYGIQVACDLCFVEGKRLQIVNWAQTIVDDWNRALGAIGLNLDELDDFNFGGYAYDEDGNLIDDATFVPTEEYADSSQYRAINEAYDILTGHGKEHYDAMKKRNTANWKAWLKENKVAEKWEAKHNGMKWSEDYLTKDQKKVKTSFLNFGVNDPKKIYQNTQEYANRYTEMEKEYLAEHPDGVFEPNKKQQAELDKLRNKQIKTIFAKMQRLIAEHPEMRKKMKLSDLLGSKGLMQIRQENGDAYAQLWSLILGRFGSGTPKPIQDAVPYSGEIFEITDGLISQAYMEGGARMFSFSDFDITKVFDIMQIYWDMAARKMKLQSYSKEAAYVIMFGKSGAKINMSTLPKAVVSDEIQQEYDNAKNDDQRKAARKKGQEYAGLIVDKDGNITDMSWSEEHSLKPSFCQQIFRDPERNGNCGAVTVGASVNHCVYAAAQPWIRMVIPFHLSGMPIEARRRTDVNWYFDNTEYQNTRVNIKGKQQSINSPKLKGYTDYNFYANEESEDWDMRTECRNYLKWCDEKGYTPRFEWGIDSDHYRQWCEKNGYQPNQQIVDIMDNDMTDGVWNGYYKFITDFNAYKPVLDELGNPTFDENGHLIETTARHTPVTTNITLSEAERKAVFGDLEADAPSVLQNRENSIAHADANMQKMAAEVMDYLNVVRDNREGKVSDAEVEKAEADMKGENNTFFAVNDAELLMDAENSDNGTKFSLKGKSEGWKQANKKAIHIAEAIERDPKFSLKRLDGTLIKAGTYFSGGGLVEEGLKGVIDPVVAVEYDEKISGVYRNNFGKHIVTADVRDVDPKELVKSIDGEVEFFHASPVCKNFSQAKANHEEVELDKETAQSTADFINQIKPAVVTIENVKGYRDSDAMKIITDALDANGYKWDADVYNAADYGGYTSRERLIVRAVKDGNLPPKPEKQPRKSGWYEAVEDIIPTLTEKKNGVAPWMDIRLQADGIDWRNIDKPLYVMGSAYADGKVPHAFADELLPTLRTKSGDVIVMPGGKVYRAMGRVLARVSGMSDDYQLPHSESLAHTIIGNGIPTQLTENVIAPLLMRENPKFSLKKSADNDNGTKFSLKKEKENIIDEAKKNGTYLKAPNGEDTNLDSDQWVTVRTSNFKNWFGDWENDPEHASKVVDENGEPKVVYHYTDEKFTEFKDVNVGENTFGNASDAYYAATTAIGTWFTDNNKQPAYMGEPMQVFLNARKPFDSESLENLAASLSWYITEEDKQSYEDDWKNYQAIVEAGKEFQRKKIKDGYDSVVIDDEEFGGTSYVSFSPNQIKSADNNNGEFSTENNDIRYSLRADRFRHDLNEWKKANNLPKDAQRPSVPVREPNETAADFMNRVKEYRKEMAMWKTAPTYEGHLLTDDTAQGEFNRELQRGAVQARIALQDSMLAIRKAQEAIMKEVGVDRLSMAEDAYTAENRSHGKGKNEFEEYNDEFLQPLRKAYNALMKKLGKSYDNVKVYMIAKHGLERNAHMAFAKALEKDYDKQSDRIDAYNAYKGDVDRLLNDTDYQNGQIDFTTWRQRDNAIRLKYAPSYMDYRYDKMGITQDYSGLSALFDGSDFEEAAADLVKDVETNHPDEAADLWYATNDATKKVLRDSYKAGMMTKDIYEYVRDMYRNYIPLRGWGDTNADQVWNYVGGGKGAFSQTLKEAHGRESLADDPIAYIENMAESGILLNNKNWVKQHLLLLAENHPTSLLNVSKAWYVKTTDAQGNEQWIPASPQITANVTTQQVELALEAFEQKMEQMKQSGDATQKREHLEISYPQTNGEEREHEVRVMRNGEEYVIYINGDPQLAQAMNNTRAQRVREGLQNSISQKVIAWVGRKMAAAYTSLSPLFIPSNYARDLTMTLASSAIREDARYNYLLRKNMLTHWNTLPLVLSYQNGTLREKVRNGSATKTEKMFYDYMMNGGETGFVSSLDVEDLKKKFKNELKDMNRMALNPKKVGHVIMDGIETLNRAIEGSNRFMVYMTSIQYGRSIEEAVNNAKDVTLNFNRKGTGEHGWQTIRNLYLFINPAIQSLQTLGALAKHHPFKFTAVTTAWLASGVLVPIINGLMMSMLGGDDDKDKYWSFTKWDRRNNMIIWVPNTHEFIKIPLAQEFRGFYGVGDMIASKLMGGEKAEQSWGEYAEDFMGQVVDMLPLDPTGYDGNIAVSLMPNPIRPFFELAFNVDFTGKPLFKDSEYNKYDPNFTKAYAGTPDWLVRISKMVNSIGNDYPDVQQNAIDKFGDPRYNLNNPAVVDHILSSYLGGAYTMGSQVLGVATKLLNGDEVKMADVPILSKFVSNPDDRPVSKKQGDEFWTTKERHDRAANTLSKLKKKAKVDGDYTTLEMFFSSDEYKQYKEDDKVVKKYEADKKKEKAEESGEEYKPHKTTYNDVYKAHATPRDDFEDLKLYQLYQKVKGFSDHWNELLDEGSSLSQGYYEQNADAIQAAEDTKTIIEQMNDIKKGFLNDGKDVYTAEDMKDLRDLRKQALSTLEKAKKGK